MQKRLVSKLAEECTENIEETRLVEINSTECNSVEKRSKRNSCTLYIVLFSIIFTISIGIGSYFLFSLVLKKRCYSCWQDNELINGKSQTNIEQKSNLLFLQRHNQSQNFESNLLKMDKKPYKSIDVYYIGYIKIKKKDNYEIFTV